MHGLFLDKTGWRYGRLTVISFSGMGKNTAFWECLCECGNRVVVRGVNLNRKCPTLSCGCLRLERVKGINKTHGMTKTAEYKAWKSMKERCSNNNCKSFPRYGGRGILVCGRWLNSFENFLSDMGKKPSPELSLERVDNNLGYSPENCKWATRREQANNLRTSFKITIGDETKTVSQWATESGNNKVAIRGRIDRGWSPEDAVFIPATDKYKP